MVSDTLVSAFKHEDAYNDDNISDYTLIPDCIDKDFLIDSWVLCGRNGEGKTCLALNYLNNHANHKNPLYLRFEINPLSSIFKNLYRESQFSVAAKSIVYSYILSRLIIDPENGNLSEFGKEVTEKAERHNINKFTEYIAVFARDAFPRTKIKKFEIPKILKIDREISEISDLSEYNIFVRFCEQHVFDFINNDPMSAIVIDAIEEQKMFVNSTAITINLLIKELLYIKENFGVNFLIAIPENLKKSIHNAGEMSSAQNVFLKIKWSNQDLKKMIKKRLKWAKESATMFDEKIGFIRDYTFGRPRDYIKYFRILIKYYRNSGINQTAEKAALGEYIEHTLEWHKSEWKKIYDDYDQIISLAKQSNISKALTACHGRSMLTNYMESSIKEILREWGVLRLVGGKEHKNKCFDK